MIRETHVWRWRTIFYVTAIIVLAGSVVIKCFATHEDLPPDIETFWPPDMLPHPIVPEDDSNDEREMS